MIIIKISLPCTVTFLRTQVFKPIIEEIPKYVEVSSHEFLDVVDMNCIYNIIFDEINVIYLSKLTEMTLSHYMEQPRSMPCRKLERSFIEEDFGDFDYNWLPNCF